MFEETANRGDLLHFKKKAWQLLSAFKITKNKNKLINKVQKALWISTGQLLRAGCFFPRRNLAVAQIWEPSSLAHI